MRHEAERDTRADLLRQLATRVTFDVPASLLDREIDRRVEEFVRRLIEQQIDPMKTNINWEEFRERQRDAAVEAVKGALVLDEVARREQVDGRPTRRSTPRSERYAERTGRTAGRRPRAAREGGRACPALCRPAPRKDGRFPALGKATKAQPG